MSPADVQLGGEGSKRLAVGGQKVYPRDHPEPKFLGQLNHPLVAAAETPFLTTGPKSRLPLGFAPLTWPYLAGIAVERRKTLDAARDKLLFARHSPGIRDKPGLALERIASTHRVVARSCANSQIPTGNNSRVQMKVINIHLQWIRATIAVTSSDCFPALN
jgi:hypothetical protein